MRQKSIFGFLSPGTQVKLHVLATNKDLTATISRRAPAADPMTRTVLFEMDVPDPERALPVGTTADIAIDIGDPEPALKSRSPAATIKGDKALVFVVDGTTAHKQTVSVKGEREGPTVLGHRFWRPEPKS